jgi:peroxiredoxin
MIHPSKEDSMRKFLLPFAGLAVFMLALQAHAGVKPGDDAPAFSLQDQSGKTVSLSDYKGKIVVLEWFNEGCPFVQRHYKSKTMDTTADKYKDKDVVWLAINSTDGSTTASNKAAADSLGVSHPILSDADGAVGKAYGAKSTPHMFIINTDGKIAYSGGIDNDPSKEGGKADTINYVDKALSEITSGKEVSVKQTEQYGCGVHYK